MGPHNVRAHPHLPILFALFTLIILSTLALFSSFDSHERAASAAPARFVLVGAMMDASPTNLTNCRQCMVTVINKSPTRNLTWSANSRGIPGVIIKPPHGILQPKGKESVNITMPSNTTCPADDTIIFTGPMNSVTISWSCKVTPTLTPATPTSTLTTVPTPSPTPSAIPTQTASPTPTVTSVPIGGGQQNNGNPPTSSDSQGSSVPSILFSVAALLLALLAFTLYVIPPEKASLRRRLLSLILPVSFLRRLDQNH